MKFDDVFFQDEVRNNFYVSGLMKQVWAAQLELLMDIASLCNKHDINWFMDFGTLLGSVRHKGFIPWDDDIDICMLREDYEKFLAIADKELPFGYELLTPYKEEPFYYLYARIANTRHITDDESFLKKFHHIIFPVGIDIFPIDYISDDVDSENARFDLLDTLSRIIANEDEGIVLDYESILSDIEEVVGIHVNRALPLRQQVYILMDKVSSIFSSSEASYVTCMSYYLKDREYKCDKLAYKDVCLLSFESVKLPAPVGYDAVLKWEFGDYMKIVIGGGDHEYPFFNKLYTNAQVKKYIDFYTYKYDKQECLNLKEKKAISPIEQAKRYVASNRKILTYIMTKKDIKNDDIIALFASCQKATNNMQVLLSEKYGTNSNVVIGLQEYNEELCRGNNIDIENALFELDKIEAILEKPTKKEIVFLSYQSKYWSRYDKLWRDHTNNGDEVYVISVPYYSKKFDGSFYNKQCDTGKYPEYVNVTQAEQYDFARRHPDVIYIQNPYDEYNYTTSIDPYLFSTNIKQYTDKLVYVPYFQMTSMDISNEKIKQTTRYFCNVPGVINADLVLVDNEDVRRGYISILFEITGDSSWEERVKCLSNDIIKSSPTSAKYYFDKAILNEEKEEYLEAYENYVTAKIVNEIHHKEENNDVWDIESKIERMSIAIGKMIEIYEAKGNIDKLREIQQTIDRDKNDFEISDVRYRAYVDIIGQNMWVNGYERRFFAYARPYPTKSHTQCTKNLIDNQTEALVVSYASEFNYTDNSNALIPIAVTDITRHKFVGEDEACIVEQEMLNHFNYYRIKGPVCIKSDTKSYYGKPVVLRHSTDRKKLVLNIFVDGLSQVILDGCMQELMPKTYSYFKDAMICKKAYSTGEWTYPSLASCVSGLEIVDHMCFHPDITTELPKNIMLLAEYFSNEGYYTAKIDGEIRSTPQYGHLRGYDRYVYQNPSVGAKVNDIVTDVINHIQTFKDTDQFIWACIGDLHDVADGLDLALAIQGNLPVSVNQKEDIGVTSVKQKYSANKIHKYKQSIKYVDMYLGMLFAYIKENYAEDEVIVSLFADHGQGYLVPENGHFISKERTNIAFMFKDGQNSFITEEPISICDYTAIMCKLAGINYDRSYTDGNLPVAFGGTTEREYVVSESLHPGDPYCVTFYAPKYTVYFESVDLVDGDGRVNLDRYSIDVEIPGDEVISKQQLEEQYIKIVNDRMKDLIRE